MNIEKWATERLILTPTKEEDLDELAPMLLNEKVSMYLNEHISKIPTIEAAKSFLLSILSYYNIVFTIKTKEHNQIIGQTGFIGINFELSIYFWLGTEYQGKGYASEATVELSYNIFTKFNYRTFSVSFFTNNIASRKVAYKICEVMLNRNPKWIVIDKEDKVSYCEVFDIGEKYVTIRINNSENSSVSYISCNKNYIPDQYLQIGKILRYFNISKIEN